MIRAVDLNSHVIDQAMWFTHFFDLELLFIFAHDFPLMLYKVCLIYTILIRQMNEFRFIIYPI